MTSANDENIDKLLEALTEEISKVTKFKTHKNRKDFFGRIKTIIKTSFPDDKPVNPRDKANIMSHPNPNKTQGHAIMTAELSAKGDELKGNSPF